jgi:hypothetical protein
MAVIINDFEVIISQPEVQAEARGGSAPADQQQALPPALAPLDIKDVVRQQMERLARIQAH